MNLQIRSVLIVRDKAIVETVLETVLIIKYALLGLKNKLMSLSPAINGELNCFPKNVKWNLT